MRKFCNVIIGDFKERVRRFSFLAMEALMLLAAFWLVPNSQLGYEILCVERNIFPFLGNKAGGVLGIVAFFIFSIISMTEVMGSGGSEI